MAKSSKSNGSANREVVTTVTQAELAGDPSVVGRTLGVVRGAAGKGLALTTVRVVGAGRGVAKGATAAGAVAGSVGRAAGRAAVTVGDLDGDGKLDTTDLRIAATTAGKAARVVAREVGELGKTVLKHDITKDAAAGAAVGALIAVPIPFVGPVAGAAVGAGFALTRGGMDSDVISAAGARVASAIKTKTHKPKTRAKPAR